MSSLTDTINVDGSVFRTSPADNFSSLISLTYTDTERKHLDLILCGFVSHNRNKIVQVMEQLDGADAGYAELSAVHDRIDLLFLLERLQTRPRLVTSVFRFSKFEQPIALLQAKHLI
jgi:hypothetical protein